MSTEHRSWRSRRSLTAQAEAAIWGCDPMELPSGMRRLIREANLSAKARGHLLQWGYKDRGNETIIGECHCGAWVVVDVNPPANGIDIGGTAVSLNCPQEEEE